MTTRRAGGDPPKNPRARPEGPLPARRFARLPTPRARHVRANAPRPPSARAPRAPRPGAHPDDHPNHPRFWVAGGAGRVLAHPMLDSSPSLDDPAALRAPFAATATFSSAGCAPARRRAGRRCLDAAASRPIGSTRPSAPRARHPRADATRLSLLSRQDIATSPEVRAVVESNALFDLVEALFGSAKPMTPAV